jgi:hypothetical protein
MMDDWDEILVREELDDKIHTLVNNPSFILFFQKDGDIFGAPEESRVVFAHLKNPDEDEGPNEDVDFMAINISRALRGEGPHTLFGKKDLKKIHVLDREKAKKKLLHQAEKATEPRKSVEMIRIVIPKRRSGNA